MTNIKASLYASGKERPIGHKLPFLVTSIYSPNMWCYCGAGSVLGIKNRCGKSYGLYSLGLTPCHTSYRYMACGPHAVKDNYE